MAVDDRDWYKDAIRKREAEAEARYNRNQFRGGKRPPPIQRYKPETTPPAKPEQSRKSGVHWTLMIMFWVAVLVITTAIVRHLHR